LVVRRRAVQEVGGFDERLRFGEDVDLVWRLVARGWRIRYEPAATVAHPARANAFEWLLQRYQYGRSAAPLARRHGRAVAPMAVSPSNAVAWMLALGGHPWSAVGLTAANAVGVVRRAASDPATAAVLANLVLAGNLRTGEALASAVRRAWLPPAVLYAGVTRRFGALAAALTVPPLVEWAVGRAGGQGPLSWLVARALDDGAYQAGLWAGMLQAGSTAALLPSFGTDWSRKVAARQTRNYSESTRREEN
jgi:hypothetical protein